MTQTCKTCKHWQEGKDFPECNITRPVHPGTVTRVKDEAEAVAVFGYAVRECSHPKVLFFQRPEIDGATVCDGSEYAACLLTAEQFGCVLHEPAIEPIAITGPPTGGTVETTGADKAGEFTMQHNPNFGLLPDCGDTSDPNNWSAGTVPSVPPSCSQCDKPSAE